MENPEAFPRPMYDNEVTGTQRRSNSAQEGMTLLDYFAAKAMQVIASHKNYDFDNSKEEHSAQMVSRKSYQLAQAMLKERTKRL